MLVENWKHVQQFNRGPVSRDFPGLYSIDMPLIGKAKAVHPDPGGKNGKITKYFSQSFKAESWSAAGSGSAKIECGSTALDKD